MGPLSVNTLFCSPPDLTVLQMHKLGSEYDVSDTGDC